MVVSLLEHQNCLIRKDYPLTGVLKLTAFTSGYSIRPSIRKDYPLTGVLKLITSEIQDLWSIWIIRKDYPLTGVLKLFRVSRAVGVRLFIRKDYPLTGVLKLVAVVGKHPQVIVKSGRITRLLGY